MIVAGTVGDGHSGLESTERRAFSIDRVIERYKRDIDRTLLREQLRKTPDQRVRELVEVERFAAELRAAGRPKDVEVVAELEALREESDREE